MHPIGHRRRGYTMSEIIVVITVLGFLAAIVVPVYSGLRRASLENAAVQNVRLVNAARDSYALTIPGAYAQWTSASDDRARLMLLLNENLLAGEPNQYLSMTGEYAVQLSGSLRTKTVLTCKGVNVEY
jgi:prepilin-type N-terminal cleavage/methylation domain-containing protein